jgi:sRNA-binding carbon storage regulator CsrA
MGKLVIKRREGASVRFHDQVSGNTIIVTVVSFGERSAKLLIEAPNEIEILRTELIDQEREANDG